MPNDVIHIKVLEEELRGCLQNQVKNTLKIGEMLLQAKKQLDPAEFDNWIDEKFRLKKTMAKYFMKAFEKFKDKPAMIDGMPQTSIFELAVGASDEVIKKVTKKAKEGKPPSKTEIKKMKSEEKKANKPKEEADTILPDEAKAGYDTGFYRRNEEAIKQMEDAVHNILDPLIPKIEAEYLSPDQKKRLKVITNIIFDQGEYLKKITNAIDLIEKEDIPEEKKEPEKKTTKEIASSSEGWLLSDEETVRLTDQLSVCIKANVQWATIPKKDTKGYKVWLKDMKRFAKRYKQTFVDTSKVIAWIKDHPSGKNGFSWGITVQSPDGLINNFPRIHAEMNNGKAHQGVNNGERKKTYGDKRFWEERGAAFQVL